MLKPTEIHRVNKWTPTLAVMAMKPHHPALRFALWEVQDEAVTAFKLSHISHLQQRNCWKGFDMGWKRERKKYVIRKLLQGIWGR